MSKYSRTEKLLVSVAFAFLFCTAYFLATSKMWRSPDVRRDMPLGKINVTNGDTRWKGATQAHQFRTWEKQRLYVGDTLYSGAFSRLGFYLGEMHVDLKPHTRVMLNTGDEKLSLDAYFGQFEIHIPPGDRLRINLDKKFLDLASVNGGRANIQVEVDRTLRVQNMAGDLIVRREGKAEYTVPEEEIIRAGD